jgi:hypothetical protein
MAQKVTVALVDDTDGGAADETIEFALDGKSYEIDLSSTNAEKLRDALARYVAAARKAGGTRRRASTGGGTAPRPKVDREQNQAIRDWARERGKKVSDRGRIPAEVLEEYHSSAK